MTKAKFWGICALWGDLPKLKIGFKEEWIPWNNVAKNRKFINPSKKSMKVWEQLDEQLEIH